MSYSLQVKRPAGWPACLVGIFIALQYTVPPSDKRVVEFLGKPSPYPPSMTYNTTDYIAVLNTDLAVYFGDPKISNLRQITENFWVILQQNGAN